MKSVFSSESHPEQRVLKQAEETSFSQIEHKRTEGRSISIGDIQRTGRYTREGALSCEDREGRWAIVERWDSGHEFQFPVGVFCAIKFCSLQKRSDPCCIYLDYEISRLTTQSENVKSVAKIGRLMRP